MRAPNQNAVAERFVQSVKQECLDYFVVFGEAHLRHILAVYQAYCHRCRPHQGLGNVPPEVRRIDAGQSSSGAIHCEEWLGGLFKHYYRAA